MRLIDADELLKGKEDHQMISTHLIWNAPTVDAVPVIRCKDCRWWDKSEDSPFGYLADQYGLWIWLCVEHHHGKMSPHHNASIDMAFKMAGQKAFEEIYSHDEWMRVFGRNYL